MIERAQTSAEPQPFWCAENSSHVLAASIMRGAHCVMRSERPASHDDGAKHYGVLLRRRGFRSLSGKASADQFW